MGEGEERVQKSGEKERERESCGRKMLARLSIIEEVKQI